MFEDRTVLYSLILVAVLLLMTLSYNNMKARQERQQAPQKDDEDTADWLCKFAIHEGAVVGETVARDGEQMILKQAGIFKSVPASQTKVVGDEVHVTGSVDWDAAIEAGSAWHQANTKGQDDAITAELTKSEDVRAPALQSTESRDEEE